MASSFSLCGRLGDTASKATTFSEPEVQYIFAKLQEHGFNYERLSEVYESRAAYNLWAFGEVNKLMDDCRRTNYLSGKRQDLFGSLL